MYMKQLQPTALGKGITGQMYLYVLYIVTVLPLVQTNKRIEYSFRMTCRLTNWQTYISWDHRSYVAILYKLYIFGESVNTQLLYVMHGGATVHYFRHYL